MNLITHVKTCPKCHKIGACKEAIRLAFNLHLSDAEHDIFYCFENPETAVRSIIRLGDEDSPGYARISATCEFVTFAEGDEAREWLSDEPKAFAV